MAASCRGVVDVFCKNITLKKAFQFAPMYVRKVKVLIVHLDTRCFGT